MSALSTFMCTSLVSPVIIMGHAPLLHSFGIIWMFIFCTQTTIICLQHETTGDESVLISRKCSHEPLYNITFSADKLRDLMQKFVKKAQQVIIANDPFMWQQNLSFNSYGIQSEGYLRDLILLGTSKTSVYNILISNSSSLHFGIQTELPTLQMTGNYQLNLNLLTMMNVFGSGEMGTLFSGISIGAYLDFLQMKNHVLQATDVYLMMHLDSAKVDIKNLYNNTPFSEYISEIAGDMLPKLVNNDTSFQIGTNFATKGLINSYFCEEQVTLEKIIDVMEHFIQ